MEQTLRYVFVKINVTDLVMIDLFDFSTKHISYSDYVYICNDLINTDYSWASYIDGIYDTQFKDGFLFIYQSTLKKFNLAIFKCGCFTVLYSYNSVPYRHIASRQILDICAIDRGSVYLCLYFSYEDINKVKRICLGIEENCLVEKFKDKEWKDVNSVLGKG